MTFDPAGTICAILGTCKVVYEGRSATAPKEIAGTNGVDALLMAMKDGDDYIHGPKNCDENASTQTGSIFTILSITTLPESAVIPIDRGAFDRRDLWSPS